MAGEDKLREMTLKITEKIRFSWLPSALALILATLFSIHAGLKHSRKYLAFSISLPNNSWVHLYTSINGETTPFKYKGIKVNSSGAPVSIRLPLIHAKYDALLLRLDKPGGRALLTDIRLINGNEELVSRLESGDIETSGSGTLEGTPGKLLLTPTGLSETLDLRINLHPLFSPVSTPPVALFLKTFLLYGISSLIIFSLLRLMFDIYKSRNNPEKLTADPPPNKAGHCQGKALPFMTAGVFLTIFGARLWLIRNFGSDLPYWDQWDAEAAYLYTPYFNGTLSISDLFAPHNEHRIMLTRLASLGLLIVNGKWSPLLQMSLNAALCGLTGAFVYRIMLTSSRIFWGFFVIIIFSLPFGWQNTLGGFQLQMYLMCGLSLLLLWLMTVEKPTLWRTVAGAASASLLLFTMASGFLTCIGLAVASAIAAFRKNGPKFHKGLLATLAICAVVTAAGFLLKTDVPAHLKLQIASPDSFAVAFAAFLGWPLSLFPILSPQLPFATAALFCAAILLWTPFILLLMKYLKSDTSSGKMLLILGAGFWIILQAAATAYARGALLLPPSRYQDIFALGLVINASSILFLLGQPCTKKSCQIIRILALLWFLGTAGGLLRMTEYNLVHDLPDKKSQQQASLEHVQAFLATNDIKTLEGKPKYDLPYPDHRKLALLLSDKDIRSSLPSSVTGEKEDGRLSTITELLLSGALFITLAGIICFVSGMAMTLFCKNAPERDSCE